VDKNTVKDIDLRSFSFQRFFNPEFTDEMLHYLTIYNEEEFQFYIFQLKTYILLVERLPKFLITTFYGLFLIIFRLFFHYILK